jgi:predicted MFS family arabinose efflux permease
LLALSGLPNGVRSHVRLEQEQGSFLQTLRADHRFLFFLLACMCITFVYFQYLSTFPLQIHMLGLANVLYGMLISINGLVVILFELPLSALTRRFPARPVIAIGWGCSSVLALV